MAIEPPELETRVAILMKRVDENDIGLPGEVAFFIAKRLRFNVRELEGALNRADCQCQLYDWAITIDFVREALRDLLALQETGHHRQFSEERWRSTTGSKSRISFPSVDPARWRVRARWRWRWRKS